MLKRFFRRDAEDEVSLSGAGWPINQLVSALKAHYGEVNSVGEDGPVKIYGVNDNGLSFVVAFLQTAPNSGEVVELQFAAKFVGFPHNAQMIEGINRNLHISVAMVENGDIFLVAGAQVTGPYDDTQFLLLLQSWRRDLALTLAQLSGSDQASFADAFPVLKSESARAFATNRASAQSDAPATELLNKFLGADRR